MKNTTNQVAKLLKYGAIILFAIALIGSFATAQKQELIYNESEYSWQETDNTYSYQTKFDGSTCFAMILSAGIACSLVFAFGEFIDLTQKRNELLEKIIIVKEPKIKE